MQCIHQLEFDDFQQEFDNDYKKTAANTSSDFGFLNPSR